MEVPSTATCDSANWAQRFAASLSGQRSRVGDFLAAKRERLELAEHQLARHCAILAAELARNRDELRQGFDAASQREAAVTAELTSLRNEHQQAVAELAQWREAEARRREAERSPAAPSAEAAIAQRDDYVRRYELALEDIHRLQAQIATLQKQLSATPAPGLPPYASPQGALDWEGEKQRVLAALEAGALGDDEGPRDDRLKIEEIIRKTEQVVAAKDRQIADLENLLRDQSCSLESVAVGATALGQMLDQDAIVREERENLKRLQDEWRERLREAEIDISVQRAKLARERAEIEEKLRLMESQAPKSTSETGASKAEKPVRGRWLARLGLKEGGENAKPGGGA